MPRLIKSVPRLQIAAMVMLGGLSLSACATKEYVNEQISAVNSRIDAVDAKATDAIQRADAANSAAQAAAADARTANQRSDQMTGRIDALEARRMRTPRN